MFKRLAMAAAALAAAAVVYAAIKPAEYTIYRETAVQAPASKIFPLINNARAAERWMPWSEIDPAVQMTYSGPEEGVGSKASWNSAGKMGVGSSTISESVPGQLVRFDLEYVKPFAMTQKAEITIRPDGAANVVRWSVSGKNAFIGRLMSLFMNMDKMVGGSFEKGLSKLKGLAES
jgi:hypothetical protein